MVRVAIHLGNNGRAIYRAGETLTGTIEMSLNHPKKFRGLCFVVYGAAECHWTETHTHSSGSGKNRRTRTSTTHYRGKEVYLNTRTYLFGRDGGDSMEIAAGTYRYEFSCFLPERIPYSFEGAYGHIRYYVEACLDIPWDFDEEIKKPFTITRTDDLNLMPELKLPVNCEDVKTFCCLFCESEPLIMSATVPCTGFTPGQNIKIKVNYINKSDVDIDHTEFTLKRIVHFNSSTPRHKTRSANDEMAKVFGPGVRPGATITFDKVLNVPQIAVTSNDKICNVVQISYKLKIEASVPGCHGNIEFSFPITIGTFPLNFEPLASAPNLVEEDELDPSAPPYNFLDLPVPKAPEDIPPPSFDEAIKMTTSNGSRVGWINPNSDFNPSSNVCVDPEQTQLVN